MDNKELRLRLIEVIAPKNGINAQAAVEVAKIYEEYITSGNADKAQAPVDTEKEQQKGLTVSTKKKPQKG